MSISVTFRPTANIEQYNEVMKQLEAAGMGKPAGRQLHVCSGAAERITIFEMWDSQAAFDAFGEYLMPILDAVEIDPGIPAIAPVNNVIP